MLNHKKVNFWRVAQNGPQCWCKIAKAIDLVRANIYWAHFVPNMGIKENYRHDTIGPVQES